MTQMNSLHVDIATELAQCAKDKTVISYGELCQRVGYPSARTIGRELEKISLLTYEKCGVFLSVLVVNKDTINRPIPMPGNGFFSMYYAISNNNIDRKQAVQQQRTRAYQQSWTDLPDIIRNKIKLESISA